MNHISKQHDGNYLYVICLQNSVSFSAKTHLNSLKLTNRFGDPARLTMCIIV